MSERASASYQAQLAFGCGCLAAAVVACVAGLSVLVFFWPDAIWKRIGIGAGLSLALAFTGAFALVARGSAPDARSKVVAERAIATLGGTFVLVWALLLVGAPLVGALFARFIEAWVGGLPAH
ncbi:MAG: hypothetical protein M3Y87_06525 [Myxococcota bacterium]|nr:hypothetical protein [Myxococcota bacterium]